MNWGQLTGDRVSALIVKIGFESSFNFVLDCEMSTVVYRDLNFVSNCFDPVLSLSRSNKFDRVSSLIPDGDDRSFIRSTLENIICNKNFNIVFPKRKCRREDFFRSRAISFSFKFVARANRCYNNRYRDCFLPGNKQYFSIFARLVLGNREKIFLHRFFRRNSWKRPPRSIKIYLRKSEAAGILDGSLDRSQIFAIARANLVFPRVCIFFVAYSWPTKETMIGGVRVSRPIDRSIEFFPISSFSSHFLLLLQMKLHLARSLKSPWNNNIHNASFVFNHREYAYRY